MIRLASIRNAIFPIGTIFGGAATGTLAISSGALTVGLSPAMISCLLVAGGCLGGAKLLTDAKARKQAAENTERLRGLSIADEESFERLRALMDENALDPRLLDELRDADPEGDPPALAIMLTLFQASQNGQLESILAQNHGLHEALVSEISAISDRLKEVHTDVVRAAERARAFPPTGLPILEYDPETHRNPYLFALQRVPFIGRTAEFNELLGFCRAEGNEKIWWLWHGPGGFGKSRLAHELCLHLLRRSWWHVGRLDLRTPYTEWSRVELTADTLFVVDYAAEHPGRAANAIARLSERRDQLSDHGHRVRFLLLERSAEGPWMEAFDRGEGTSDAELLNSARYRPPRALGPVAYDVVLDIVEYILNERGFSGPIDGRALTHLLDNVDPLNRPLYAAILADAIADRGMEAVRDWGQGELLGHVLETEMLYWARRGVDAAHVNALVLATLSGGGLRLTGGDLPGPIAEAKRDGLLPDPRERAWQTIADFTGHFGLQTTDPLPALEPDILGEKFVLDRLAGGCRLPPLDGGASSEETHTVVEATRKTLRLARLRDRDAAAIAALRCLRDHPRHPAIDTLLAPPVADPEEAAVWSRICVDGVTLLASIGDLDRAEKVYAELVAVSEGEHATGESRLVRAMAGVNLVNDLGETQEAARLDRADEVYQGLVALSEGEHATGEIRLRRAMAGMNLVTDFGETRDAARLDRADEVYQGLVALSEGEHATGEIRHERAKAGVNLVNHLGVTQEAARLDRADAVYQGLVALSEGEHATGEIRHVRARAGVNLVYHLGQARDAARLDRADEVYRELVALSEGEHATGEIRLERARAGVYLVIDFGKTRNTARLDRANVVYRELVALSSGEHATGEIRLGRAKAGVGLARGLALCGKRDRARTLLRESLDHFTSCNEIELARRTRELLAFLDQN